MAGQGEDHNTLQVLVAVLNEQYSGIKATLGRIESKMDIQAIAQVELDKRIIKLEMGAEAHQRMMTRLWVFASSCGVAVFGLILRVFFFS